MRTTYKLDGNKVKATLHHPKYEHLNNTTEIATFYPKYYELEDYNYTEEDGKAIQELYKEWLDDKRRLL